jgi:hypothetical protein
MNFDDTVTLGNLLTIATLLAVAIAGFIRIDLKIQLHEKWIQEHAECNRRQIEILTGLEKSLAFIRGSLGLKTED